MPVVIMQLFPLGRYHATRWNQNPFEDRFGEWPPSPWRLLRALAARWFQYARESGTRCHEIRDELLRALAVTPPAFRLPIYTLPGRPVRQYQPTALELQYKYKKNAKTKKNELEYAFRQPSKTLVVDRYRTLPSTEAVFWIWESCDLTLQALELLRELLRRIHYFGRAETWTIMRLVGESEPETLPNCKLDENPSTGAVPVLVPRPDQVLDLDVLLASTEDKRLSNRRIPEGTAWFYADLPRPLRTRRSTSRRRFRARMHVARYTLDSTVLPLATATLPVAERARAALMARMPRDGDQRRPSRIFSGKDALGRPLVGHGHAYFLPTDEDGDGRLDHLTVFAKDGFGEDEARAIDHLRVLRPIGNEPEIRLLLLGIAQENQFQVPPLGPAETWVSATPFIATRHPKKNGVRRDPPELLQDPKKFIAATLEEELERLNQRWGMSIPDVEPLLDEAGVFRICPSQWQEGAVGPRRRAIEFKRFRSRKSPDDGGRRRSGFFKLRFPEPVRGPISLGHSAHFGMGLFLPEANKAR